MRWIVITLLVVNVAYFIWQQSFMGERTPSASSVSSSKTPLRLASEVVPSAPNPPEPEAPAPPESVELVAEAVVGAVPEASVATPEPAKVEPEPVSVKVCYSVGPISVMSDVSSLSKMFEKVEGVETQQRAAAERSQAGYWVFVPPFDTLSAARAVLRDLQNRTIRDVLVISEGAKANAISAGVYNVESQAAERRDSIRAYGYKAEIETLFRTQPQYWLDVELTNQQTIPADLWRQVVKRFPGTKRIKRTCE